MVEQFELVVLGGGPGGYVAAIRAAQLGAKVALIEQARVGGTCLNRGCIPTKALIACTNFYEKILKAENLGITLSNPTIDPAKIVERKNKLTEKIVSSLEQLLKKKGITIIEGKGTVLEPGRVEIERPDNSKLSVVSDKLVLATGSVPATLPGLELDGKRFFCSDQALQLPAVPAKLAIVGGGVIGIHFAFIYSTLGTAVTIYEALPDILNGIDEEIVNSLKRILRRRKIEVLTGTKFDPQSWPNPALICVGRRPNLTGLEKLGLEMNGQSVKVNNKLETSRPGIYAVGDLVSQKMLAHVAYEQGVVAAENALGTGRTYLEENVPIGIYTSPEIASVGLSEKEARKKIGEIKIGKFNYAALGIAQAMGEIEGLIKVVAKTDGSLLGIHIIGAEACALVGIATVAIKNKLDTDQLGELFQAHPSYQEGLQEAALSVLDRGLHSL